MRASSRSSLQQFGVSLEKYKCSELIERIAGMIVLPVYILPSLIKSIGSALALIIALSVAFVLIHKSAVGFFIFMIVGLLFGVTTGFFWGLMKLINQATQDVRSLMGVSLDLVRNIALDIQTIIKTRTNEGSVALGPIPQPTDILQEVMGAIILPAVGNVCRKKVALCGGFISCVFEKILQSTTNTLSALLQKTIEQNPLLANLNVSVQKNGTKAQQSISTLPPERVEALLHYSDQVALVVDALNAKTDFALTQAQLKASAPVRFLFLSSSMTGLAIFALISLLS